MIPFYSHVAAKIFLCTPFSSTTHHLVLKTCEGLIFNISSHGLCKWFVFWFSLHVLFIRYAQLISAGTKMHEIPKCADILRDLWKPLKGFRRFVYEQGFAFPILLNHRPIFFVSGEKIYLPISATKGRLGDKSFALFSIAMAGQTPSVCIPLLFSVSLSLLACRSCYPQTRWHIGVREG